jgi:hypothetical protein
MALHLGESAGSWAGHAVLRTQQCTPACSNLSSFTIPHLFWCATDTVASLLFGVASLAASAAASLAVLLWLLPVCCLVSWLPFLLLLGFLPVTKTPSPLQYLHVLCNRRQQGRLKRGLNVKGGRSFEAHQTSASQATKPMPR